MAIYKAIKLEIMILVEASMSDEDIIDWTERAMKDYCEFDESVVKITQRHENVTVDLNAEAQA